MAFLPQFNPIIHPELVLGVVEDTDDKSVTNGELKAIVTLEGCESVLVRAFPVYDDETGEFICWAQPSRGGKTGRHFSDIESFQKYANRVFSSRIANAFGIDPDLDGVKGVKS